jgi:hypothetical protein
VLKRWAGQTANSVFVHVDESLQGMDVIRAFAAVDYFIQVRMRSHQQRLCMLYMSMHCKRLSELGLWTAAIIKDGVLWCALAGLVQVLSWVRTLLPDRLPNICCFEGK